MTTARDPGAIYSTEIFLSAMILPEAAMSSAWNFAKSPGLPPPTTRPSATSFSPMSPVRALFTAALSLLTTSAGVLAGAHRPYQLAQPKPASVSLAVATNVLAGLTGSASGGLTIALDALGPTFSAIAADTGLSVELMHRVAVIGAGTLDSLPHNGAVITLLAVCGCTHRESYRDIAVAAIVGPVVALVVVIVLGAMFGSF